MLYKASDITNTKLPLKIENLVTIGNLQLSWLADLAREKPQHTSDSHFVIFFPTSVNKSHTDFTYNL